MATKKEFEKLMKTCLSTEEQTAYNSLIVLKKRANDRHNHLLLIQCRIVPVFFQLLELVEVKNLTDRRRKTIDLLFSILGDLCNLQECRDEVYKHSYGLEFLVLFFCECEHESIQNRSCRTLANLAKHPGLCESIHKTDFIETLVTRMETTENVHHQHTYCRAVRLLGNTQHQKDRILSHNAIYQVCKLIECDDASVRKEVCEVIEDYALNRPSCEFATQLIRSGAFKVIVSKLGDKDNNSTFSLLCKLNHISNIRPEFGSAGGLQAFIEMFHQVTDLSIQLTILNIVCLCCKESVNRVKVRNLGGLKILCETLKNKDYQKIHDRIISALQCFVFDEAGLNVLLEYDLVSILILHLQRVAEFESTIVSVYDYYFTEEEFLSPKTTFTPGKFEKYYVHLAQSQESDDHEKDMGSNKNVFSIDSPTYEPRSDWSLEEYQSGARCKETFEYTETPSSSPASLSPLSTVSFYSPSLSPTSDYSPPSSPGGLDSSTVNRDPNYPFVCSVSYKTDSCSPGGYSPEKDEEVESFLGPDVYSESEDEESTETMEKCEEVKLQESRLSEQVSIPRISLFKNKREAADMSEDEEIEPTVKRTKTAVMSPVKRRRQEASSTEQHILIILSRISQMYDPTKYLVNLETICCCLDYLALVDKPEKRMARTLCRIIGNPLCLNTLLQIHMPVLIYHKLLRYTGISYRDKILQSFLKSKHECLKTKEWSKIRSRSDSVDSTSSQLSFLDLEDFWSSASTSKSPENLKTSDKESKSSASNDKKSSGEESLSFPFKAGLILLQDVSTQVDGPYGRGEVAHWLHKTDPDTKDFAIFSLLFALWNTGMTKHYFIKQNFMEAIFKHVTSDLSHPSKRAVIEALCFVGHILFMSHSDPSNHEVKLAFSALQNSGLTAGTGCRYESVKCKDVSFHVQDTILSGNRETLVKSSDLFQAMLEGHYSESREQEVVLSNTTPFAVNYILHYLHGCDLSCEILGSLTNCDKSEEALCNILDTVVLGHRYMLTELVNFLLILLEHNVSSENACHVFHFALTYDLHELIVTSVKSTFSSPCVAERVNGFHNFLGGPDADHFISVLFDLLLERTY
ncbi:uncharacterized protein LOC133197639 [Saccostrea echinata]|uniref:uncharacterized protein LOC133197639 n=1 Tax=Saccostrea echinata TaxID=191078 RepID=UPI002A829B2C|nr:uncharacterized protein LOC133197639 [Saccostrea echinata]